MDDKDYEIREVFAYYGRAMYLAQTVEKGITQLLIVSRKGFTKDRYDELLAEKTKLTFGQLKRELTKNKIYDENLLNRINEFHEKRNWLAHNFWWDRAVEFCQDNLRYKLFEELEKLTLEFEELNDLVRHKAEKYFREHGIDMDVLVQEFSTFESTPKTPEVFPLSKNETVQGIFTFSPIRNAIIPIFQLADKAYWTLCEVGLTQYKKNDLEGKLIPIKKLQDIFPIKQFNPRPKVREEWDYDLELKRNGLFIEIKPAQLDNKFAFKWAIRKH